MPVNRPLLLVYQALFAVGEAIRLVQRALARNPSADKEMELRDLLTDLMTLKDELMALKEALENGETTLPPPDPALLDSIADLIRRVESARVAGAAAQASLNLAGQVMNIAMTVMTYAR